MTIQIKFEPAKTINVTEQGEHRTVTLECKLPADFKGIDCGEVEFVIGTEKTLPYPFPSELNPGMDYDAKKQVLRITLWSGLTASRFMRLQVTGYTTNGKKPKTPLSELLRFSASISGGEGEAPPNTIGELLRLKHSHLNKQILDAFSEESDTLFWKGEPVCAGGSSTIPGPPGADGQPGSTFTPSVSEDGTLTWTNNGDLPNPDPVNIMGPPGEGGGTAGGITVADVYKPYANFWHVLDDSNRPPLVLAEADYTSSTPVPPPNQWEQGLGDYTQDFGKTLTFRPLDAPDLSPFDDWPDGNYQLILSNLEAQGVDILLQRFFGYSLLSIFKDGKQFAFGSDELLGNIFGLELPTDWYRIIDDNPLELEPATVQEIGVILADSAQMLFDGPVDILGLLFSATAEEFFAAGHYDLMEDGVTYQFIGPSAGGSVVPGPPGEQGPPGESITGPVGPAGPGVPSGGTAGQVLTKNSPAPYDTIWANPTSGGGASPAATSLALEMTAARVGVQTFVPSSFVLPDERLQTIQDRPLFVTRAAVNDITVTLMDSVWPLYAGELWLNPDFSTASLVGGTDKKCDVTLKTSSLMGGATDSVAAQICIGMTQTIPVPLTPGVAYAWVGGVNPIYNYMGQVIYYIVTVKGAVTLTLPGLGPVAFPGAGVYSVGAGGAVSSGYSGVNLFLQEPLDCADDTFLGRKAFLRRQPLSYVVSGLQAGLYMVGLTGLVQIGGA